MAPPLTVVAAVIERDGHLLVTRRPTGVHLEGYWEFPGGKVDEGESHADSLVREIREELDCEVTVGDEIWSVAHSYPDRRVELHFYRCGLSGDPRPQLGQEMLWVCRPDLRTLQFPPADLELIERLTGPEPPVARSP